MNPYVKEDWFLHHSGEETYVDDEWHDTGLWVKVGGLGLLLCTITISTEYSCNVGFRIVDENNNPLPPYRKKENNRHSVHFSHEPYTKSTEDLTPVTFHMIANCQYAKLQIRPSDFSIQGNQKGNVRINFSGSDDASWHHKPLSTMSVMPLISSG